MSECVTNLHYKNQSFPQYWTQLFTNQMAVTNEQQQVSNVRIQSSTHVSFIYVYPNRESTVTPLFSIVTTYKWMVIFMARLTHTYSFRHIDDENACTTLCIAYLTITLLKWSFQIEFTHGNNKSLAVNLLYS